MTIDQFPEPRPLPKQFQTDAKPRTSQDPEAWRDEALCAQIGGDAWFPEKGGKEPITVLEARDICARCPVRAQCLQYALDTDQRYGIWGGLSAVQRNRLRTTPRRSAEHGTDAMYRKGCTTDEACPNKYSCAQAHRDYQRAWDQKRKAAGIPRRKGHAA